MSKNKIQMINTQGVDYHTFDSAFTRDYYYPEEGVYGEPIRKAVEKHQDIYDKLFGTYFISEERASTDYELFARAK